MWHVYFYVFIHPTYSFYHYMNIFAKNSGITEKHKNLIILHLSIKGRALQIFRYPNYSYIYYHMLVQSLSCVRLFATPWTIAYQASLSITNSWSLLKLISIESVMPSNHLILCHPFSSCLQSFPASGSFPISQLFASGGQSIMMNRMDVKLQKSSVNTFYALHSE